MQKTSQDVSVIIPVLNEYDHLPELERHISLFYFGEVIYVDGGSSDGSWQWLQENVELAIQSETGRAKQMNAGAQQASKDYLLFMHADTRLPQAAAQQITTGLELCKWGRFDLQFLGNDWFMPIVAYFINLRSRVTGISTGDQCLFLARQQFQQINGFSDIPIMEDVEIAKRLRKLAKPYCSSAKIRTSPRRWLEHGRLKTILLMWRLRWRYYRGASPDDLRHSYHDVR